MFKNFKKYALISTLMTGTIVGSVILVDNKNKINNITCLKSNNPSLNSTNVDIRNTINTTPNYDVINLPIQVDASMQTKYASELTLNDLFSLLAPVNVINWFNNLPADYGDINSQPIIVRYSSNDKEGSLSITFKLTYAILDGVYDISTDGFNQTQTTVNLVGFKQRLETIFEPRLPDKTLNATNIVEYFSGTLNNEVLEIKTSTFLNLRNKPNTSRIKSVMVKRNTYEDTIIEFTFNQVNVQQGNDVVLFNNYSIQLKINGFKPNWSTLSMSIIKPGDSSWCYDSVIINYGNTQSRISEQTSKIIFYVFVMILSIVFLGAIIMLIIFTKKKPTASVSL